MANSVERLMVRREQSSSVVSQGLGVDMAAGAAVVMAAGEAIGDCVERRPIPLRSRYGLARQETLP